jgi:phosphatidate cytidylyltransferase
MVAWGTIWLGGALAIVPDLGMRLLPIAAAVSIGDVAAYFGGALANRWAARKPFLATRLSPLSPNKTWAGVLTGSLAALATLAVLGTVTVACAVAVTAGAVVGDLVESLVKRGCRVKDAGSWLPGFGGLCDRVDSLLGALLVIGLLT